MLGSSCMRNSIQAEFPLSAEHRMWCSKWTNVVHFGVEHEFSRLVYCIVLFFHLLFVSAILLELHFKMRTDFYAVFSAPHSPPYIASIKKVFLSCHTQLPRPHLRIPSYQRRPPRQEFCWCYFISPNISKFHISFTRNPFKLLIQHDWTMHVVL